MHKRLPSLTSLRTFEAAARKLSFANAAAELSVTPAAVGFQIKQLEDELGYALFVRRHRSVVLTDRGRDLAQRLAPAFQSIQTAWNDASSPRIDRVLRVSGGGWAIHNWIWPALSKAQKSMPNMQIAWDMSPKNRDILGGECDVAIRYTPEPEADLHCEPLLLFWYTPVARPEIARLIDHPKDLEKHGLIDVEVGMDAVDGETAWDPWFRLMGMHKPTEYAVRCEHSLNATETAMAIGHVAISGSFMASAFLKSGYLVAPFDKAIVPNSRFWLVCRKGEEKSTEIQWLLDTVRQGAAEIDALAAGIDFFDLNGQLVAK